jgi:hypothetical protein
MLNDAADIDDKHLKTILNYNLDVQRGEIEMNKEVISEFFHMLKDPKISEMKAKIMMKFNFAKKE